VVPGAAAFGAAASWALVFFCTLCMAVPMWPRCRPHWICLRVLSLATRAWSGSLGRRSCQRRRSPGRGSPPRRSQGAAKPVQGQPRCSVATRPWTDVGVEGEDPGLATAAPGASGPKASRRFVRAPGRGERSHSGPATDQQCGSAGCGELADICRGCETSALGETPRIILQGESATGRARGEKREERQETRDERRETRDERREK